MKNVLVSVTNDLVTDQRVHRSCSALLEAGLDVVLIGRKLPDSSPLNRPYRTVRMHLLFRRKAFFYAEFNIRLFFKLLFSKADLFFANDTDSLPANYFAARLRRKPLLFDAHELFPEVPELVTRPRVKRVWTAIEDFILPRIAKRHNMAAVTVCQSIADIYQQRYSLHMEVVRNVPIPDSHHDNMAESKAQALLSAIPHDKHLLLYQGAVNLGRGIDWILDAMQHLPDCHFVVAGVGDEYSRLKAIGDAMSNVSFLGRVEPAVLHCLSRHADLGLALLENRGLNYYYSLPNRLADYIHAGVPVLATDFPEIHRVVAVYEIGTLIPPVPFDSNSGASHEPDPQQLASSIKEALHYWYSISPAEKEARFKRAAADLSWENDKKVLINTVRKLLK